MDTQRDDSELVRRACAGDRGALAELVEMARARMFPTAYAELRHYDDAQDAVGAALLQVCLHLRELRDPGRLHGWMHSIVRNEARRIRRARLPETPDGLIDDEEAPAPALPESLLRLDIERALYRLPWDEARAVALFYLKGESIRQIARRLDRPEGTVKRWLCLGRRQLARELEAYAPLTPALKRQLRRILVHSVGAHPTRVAADPVANRLYVADATGALTILDGSANAVAAQVSVGRGALALAVNPVSNKIYLAHAPVEKDRHSGDLTVIDGRSYQVVAVVEVGNTPRAVAVNPQNGKVYVASTGEDSVSVVDGDQNRLAATIAVGSQPVSLALNPETGKVYIANWGSCNVTVIDGSLDRVISVIPVGAFPMDIAVNPLTNRVYVANCEDDTVSVLDGAADRVIGGIPVGRRPVGLAVNASTNELYVTHSSEDSARGSLRVIDASTYHTMASAAIGGGLRNVAVDPATNSVYVADGGIGAVSVLKAG